jgi:cheR methyltransferase, SAM binding domain
MFVSELQDLGIKETRMVVAAIRLGHGDDFTDFNLGILCRRFAMVMNRLGMRQVDALCDMLSAGDAKFYDRFLAELVPPTTELLRDPTFWKLLKEEILPALLKQFGDLRILQLALGSGEELYSLLIVLHLLEVRERVAISCAYACEQNLALIQRGLLPIRRKDLDENNFHALGTQSPYEAFIKSDHDVVSFRVEYLEGVHFFRLSPEFSLQDEGTFHLILCRNQFLYFNPQLGMRNMAVLFRSLVGGGVVALGTKENLESYQNDSIFTVLNGDESLYRKRL